MHLRPSSPGSVERRLLVLALSLAAAALGVFSLSGTKRSSHAAELLRNEEVVVIEGPAEARALSHLPLLAYDLDAFDVALEVHPRFGMEVSSRRLLLSISEAATVGELKAALQKEGLSIVGSIGCARSERQEGRILRPGDRGLAGLDDFVLGTLLVSLQGAGDFAAFDAVMDRLWKHEAVSAVAYVAPWGIGLDRLPGPSSDRAKSWIPRLSPPPSRVRTLASPRREGEPLVEVLRSAAELDRAWRTLGLPGAAPEIDFPQETVALIRSDVEHPDAPAKLQLRSAGRLRETWIGLTGQVFSLSSPSRDSRVARVGKTGPVLATLVRMRANPEGVAWFARESKPVAMSEPVLLPSP